MADAFDDFLNHSGRDSGGGKFLGNWKKREPPQVDTWMHTALSPKPSWRHQFYKVETRENKDTRDTERVVWSFQFNCHEAEEVLKKQYKTDDDGRREKPPCTCPLCRCVDFVRQAVVDGRLSPFEPIFRFEGSDEDQAVTLHAAGLYGGFPRERDDFSDDEENPLTWKKFRDAKLSLKDVWKENVMAKLSYVFAVVDQKDVSRGVQIAVETALLGEKVRGVIADRRDRLGVEEGSFAKNPCAIRWFHRPSEKEFNKKYHATDIGLNKLPLTEEIEELIRGEARDVIERVTKELAPGDPATLRALMERYSVVDLPFDKFFEGHDSKKAKDSKDKKRDEDEPAPEVRTSKPKADAKPAKAPPKPAVEEFECDECGATVTADDTECPKCGADLDDADDAPKAPPPQAKKPPVAKDDAPAKKKPIPF